MKRLKKECFHDIGDRECAILWVEGEIITGCHHYDAMDQYILDNNLEMDYFDKGGVSWGTASLVRWEDELFMQEIYDKICSVDISYFNTMFDFWKPGEKRVFVDDLTHNITFDKLVKELKKYYSCKFYHNNAAKHTTFGEYFNKTFGEYFIEDANLENIKNEEFFIYEPIK